MNANKTGRFLGLCSFGVGIATMSIIPAPFKALSAVLIILGAFVFVLFEEPRLSQLGRGER